MVAPYTSKYINANKKADAWSRVQVTSGDEALSCCGAWIENYSSTRWKKWFIFFKWCEKADAGKYYILSKLILAAHTQCHCISIYPPKAINFHQTILPYLPICYIYRAAFVDWNWLLVWIDIPVYMHPNKQIYIYICLYRRLLREAASLFRARAPKIKYKSGPHWLFPSQGTNSGFYSLSIRCPSIYCI